MTPYGPLLASFRSQIDPPNFIWTESHQFSTKSTHFIIFSIFHPGSPRYLLPGPPLSSFDAIYSELGLLASRNEQSGFQTQKMHMAIYCHSDSDGECPPRLALDLYSGTRNSSHLQLAEIQEPYVIVATHRAPKHSKPNPARPRQ